MIESRLNLIDSMRGRWERSIPFRLLALYCYVEGYAEARGFADIETWKQISLWVNSYFASIEKTASNTGTWLDRICKAAPTNDCEIPIFYAALDFGREQPIENVLFWNPSDQWKEAYIRDQLMIPRYGSPVPPPHILKLGCDKTGIWRVFFFDKNGLRYDETAMRRTKREAKSWAYHCLHVPEAAWVKAL